MTPVACVALALGIVLVSAAPMAAAQSPLPGGLPPPPGMPMPVYAAHRFPQRVLVGSLVGALVQRPVESHDRLGTVRAIVRNHDGQLQAVVRYGGLLGYGGRDIAVDLDAMALLGPVIEIVGFTPHELDHFPTYAASSAVSLSASEVVRVGLAKPSH